MSHPSEVITETLEWRGVTLRIDYQPLWIGPESYFPSLLEVEAVDPPKAPLPITETGYRSEFPQHGVVEAAGGPTAYVTAWLEEAAKSPAWRAAEAAARQLSLF